MLVLFETAAGFALFKLLDEGKLKKATDLYSDFESVDSAQKVVSLKKFARFKNTADALDSTTALIENKLSKNLKKFLNKQIVKKELNEKLAVADAKLGGVIKEELGIKCVHDSSVMELMRGIRAQLDNLVTSVSDSDLNSMNLGLSHSLSRYKLKFSPDKVDTMIVQAISLLDDLDKELNTYAMRVREWYGWHFPELTKVIPDNLLYAKTVKLMGSRANALTTNFSEIMPEEIEEELKEAAQISMGTEVSDEDIDNIKELCDQVISITEYREQLYEYLKNRMLAIAPNLTVLVGELVGARLIAHAGSLLNLAKHPASTVQILGAEKALFRALKTKHETPKYGLIYHASLIGQTAPKNKGKISRVLAAKAALAIRCDALGEGETSTSVGVDGRAKVEARMRSLESGHIHSISGTGKGKPKTEKYDNKKTEGNGVRATNAYNKGADSTMGMEVEQTGEAKKEEKKKKQEEVEEESSEEEEEKPKKEKKKEKKAKESKKDKKKEKKKKAKKESSEEEESSSEEESSEEEKKPAKKEKKRKSEGKEEKKEKKKKSKKT